MKRIIGVLILICMVMGCAESGDFRSVTGTITLDGELAEGVDVIFVPIEGGRANSKARTEADGSYSLSYTHQQSGTQPGTYKVLVCKEESNTGRELIPGRYSSGGRSELKAEVTEQGDNVFNFEIESK